MAVRCPKCGAELLEGQQCPHCSSKGEGKPIDKIAYKTGEALEKGVEITGKAVEELKPAAKAVADTGKKGLKMLKDSTLQVAKDLKKRKEE